MSWKSIVSAGLLCLFAVPAWAAPSASVTLLRGPNDPGPADPVLLDANGDFQYQVKVTPDNTQAVAGHGTVGAELAFLIGGTGLASAAPNNAAQWDQNNPGLRPTAFGSGFAWLVNGVSGDPEGLQTNTGTDEVFASLGSINFATGTASNYILIKGVGPARTSAPATATSRQNSVQWGGAYSGSGVLAQEPISPNTTTSGTTGTYFAIIGDANLNGVVDLADFNAVINNFGFTTNNWNLGNMNNTKGAGNVGITATTVDLADFNDVINNFGDLTPGGGGIAVPEPASIALVLMALSMVVASARRR